MSTTNTYRLYLPFQSVCLYFLFLALLNFLDMSFQHIPVICWIAVGIGNTIVSFPILRRKQSIFSIKDDVSYGIFVGVLHQVEDIIPLLVFLSFYQVWVSNIVKYLYCINWYDIVIYLLYTGNMVDYND